MSENKNTAGKIILAAAATVAAWAVAIKPRTKDKPDMSVFGAYDYANGGLHDYCKGTPENTRTSLEKAFLHGYGVALNVRLTKDEVPVVFTDHELWRMCSVDGNLEDKTYDQLRELSLLGTEEKILRLADALQIIDGQVPVLVNILPYGENQSRICANVAHDIEEYEGVIGIESHCPLCVAWFAKYYPEIIRGQILDRRIDFNNPLSRLLRQIAKHFLLTNIVTRPDFMACKLVDTKNISLSFCKLLFHVPIMNTDICTVGEYEKARMSDAMVTFEDIQP